MSDFLDLANEIARRFRAADKAITERQDREARENARRLDDLHARLGALEVEVDLLGDQRKRAA